VKLTNSNGSELKLQGKKVCSAFATEGSENSLHLVLFWNLWEEKEAYDQEILVPEVMRTYVLRRMHASKKTYWVYTLIEMQPQAGLKQRA
jgi:hypothetical protein